MHFLGANISKIKLRWACILSCALIVSGVNTVQARSSGFSASIKQSAVWDSNPLMLTSGEEDIYGSDTKVSFSYDKETSKKIYSSSLSVSRNQFDHSEFNSTDLLGYVGLNLNFRRLQLKLDGDASYDTTRTSEITTFGRDIGSIRRSMYSVSPAAFYSISQRSAVSLSVSWEEVRYDDSGLTDYRTYSVSPAFVYNVTPLQELRFGGMFNRYQSLENNSQKVNTTGPYISWLYKFKPYLSLKLSGSLLKTKYEGYSNVSSYDEVTPTYSAELAYRDDTNELDFSVVKSRHPYSNGVEAYLTTFVLQEGYKVNDKLFVNLKGRYQDAKQPPVSGGSLDNLWGVDTGLSYKISRNWFFSASYQYKEEVLNNSAVNARKNMARLGISCDL